MMRRRERDEVLEAIPEIPFELQIEIVNRLPIKSLARFKCVSKLWSSLIRSKGYLFPSSPRLYIKAPRKYALLPLASTAFDLDRMIDDGIEGFIIGAVRGLVLYKLYCGQVCIYNPTTGQSVTLLPPRIDIFPEKEAYFLGYDPVLDQYKVVYTAVVSSTQGWRYAQNWVFLLGAGSSWKRIEFNLPYFSMIQGPLSINGLCINGVIYYLAHSYVSRDNNIISFDVRSEEFNTIQLPHAISKRLMIDRYSVGFIEYGGKPTLFDLRPPKPDQSLNLWILENAGKWSKESLVLQDCHMHFFPDNIFCFQVIGATQNGEVVLKPKIMYSDYHILYYDLHKNDVRRIDIRGISGKPPLQFALMEHESIMHLKI